MQVEAGKSLASGDTMLGGNRGERKGGDDSLNAYVWSAASDMQIAWEGAVDDATGRRGGQVESGLGMEEVEHSTG